MPNILKCDCCGKVAKGIHDFLRFSENSETGEELWICKACDDIMLAEMDSPSQS